MTKKFEEKSDGLKKRDLRADKTTPEVDLIQPVEIETEEVVAAPQVDRKSQRRGGNRERNNAPKVDSEFIEKVVAINRITKVTKGGKKLSFSALVVVGDAKGHVGYSLEKAAEVSIAIRKAIAMAKKSMMDVPMKGTTIPHAIVGECGAASVLLKPASEGTGVIASGAIRAICDGAGIRNILTKCHKSNNPVNVVKATFDGFSRLKSVANVANVQG